MKSPKLFVFLAVVVAVSMLAASCGGGQPSSPSVTGQLSVNPLSMSFGSVNVGSNQSKSGTLSAGSAPVVVSSASWNGSGYSLSGITFPTTIAAGSSIPFKVTFTPQAAGSAPGQVSFISDTQNSPVQVLLAGTGAAAANHSVDLSWGSSTSQVAGYNLYRGTQSAGPYAKLNGSLIAGLSFTDASVQSGATYYYVATSVDSNQVESGYSNVATAVIP